MTTASKRLWVKEFSGVKARFEACFSGLAYAPHRHDTYTLAITTRGVQSFNYRGEIQHSLPGQVIVLHPDELHDGQAGSDEAFAYKAINIAPSEFQQVLCGDPLPFIDKGVNTDARLQAIACRLLGDLTQDLTLNQYEDEILNLATLLQQLAGYSKLKSTPNLTAASVAKEYLDDHLFDDVSLDKLAIIAQFSKWQLSRDFKAIFGTSPHRYQVLRRLHKAKDMMLESIALADVALICHFSDQAHFTRQFKAAFGLTPKQWQLTFNTNYINDLTIQRELKAF